jgi:hypothetical protein
MMEGVEEAAEVEGMMHIYTSETGAWSDRSTEWKRGEEGGEWG